MLVLPLHHCFEFGRMWCFGCDLELSTQLLYLSVDLVEFKMRSSYRIRRLARKGSLLELCHITLILLFASLLIHCTGLVRVGRSCS
jgi:hypothetical protein